jgi:pseudouridine kinase
LLTELAAAGVECRDVARLAGRVTASYTAVLDEAGELICGLADGDIYDTLDAARLEALAPGLAGWPIWALDANLPHAGIAALAACKPAGVRLAGLAVSPAKAARLDAPLAAFDMLFANRTEAAVLAERQVDTAAEAVAAAAALRARGPGLVCVTLGAEGVAVAAAEGTALHPARQTGVVNVNGAGDAFAAGVLDGIAGGSPPNDAIARGLAAAALTARSPETCSPELSAKEVENGD